MLIHTNMNNTAGTKYMSTNGRKRSPGLVQTSQISSATANPGNRIPFSCVSWASAMMASATNAGQRRAV
jgi:hypothetical protein